MHKKINSVQISKCMNRLLYTLLFFTIYTVLYGNVQNEKHEYPQLLNKLREINIRGEFAVTNNEEIILIDNKLRIYGKKVRSYSLPPEYRRPSNFKYDEIHNTVYINAYDKIGCFTLQGKLLKEIKVWACDFFLQNDTIFIFGDDPLSMGMYVNDIYERIDFPVPILNTLSRDSIQADIEQSICNFKGKSVDGRVMWNGWKKEIYEFTLRKPSQLICDTLITPFEMVLIGEIDNTYLFLDFDDKTPLPIYEYNKITKQITTHLLHNVGERLDRYFDNGDSIEHDWGNYPTVLNKKTKTLYIFVNGKKYFLIYKWKMK